MRRTRQLILPSRRSFIAGAGAGLLAAPAIVRAGSLTLMGVGKPAAGGGGGGGPTLTFQSAPAPQSGSSALTFSSVPIGSAAADRVVIVSLGGQINSSTTSLTVQINGSTATASGFGVFDAANQFTAEIYYATVTSGATCTVTVTPNGASANIGACNLAIYTLTGAQQSPKASHATNTFNVTFSSMSIGPVTIPSTGFAIAAIQTDRNITCTWPGATVDAHQVGVVGIVNADLFALSSNVAGSATFTSSGNAATNYIGVMTTWGP